MWGDPGGLISPLHPAPTKTTGPEVLRSWGTGGQSCCCPSASGPSADHSDLGFMGELWNKHPPWAGALVSKIRTMEVMEQSLALQTICRCLDEYSQVGPGRRCPWTKTASSPPLCGPDTRGVQGWGGSPRPAALACPTALTVNHPLTSHRPLQSLTFHWKAPEGIRVSGGYASPHKRVEVQRQGLLPTCKMGWLMHS
jgi:hypothetical protein